MFIFVGTSTWTNATNRSIYKLSSATTVLRWVVIQIQEANRGIHGTSIKYNKNTIKI